MIHVYYFRVIPSNKNYFMDDYVRKISLRGVCTFVLIFNLFLKGDLFDIFEGIEQGTSGIGWKIENLITII